MKAIALQSWSGIRYEPVEVVGETPKRLRVKILAEQAKLAGRCKWAVRGDVVQTVRMHAYVYNHSQPERHEKQ